MNQLFSIKTIVALLIFAAIINLNAFAQRNTERSLTVQEIEGISNFMLTPDGNKAVVVWDLYAWVVDLLTGEILLEFAGHANDPNPPEASIGSPMVIDISPDGKYVATGDFRATVFVWDIEAGEILHTIRTPSAEVDPRFVSGKEILSVKFSPDKRYLATAQTPSGPSPVIGVQIWDLQSGKPIFEKRLSAAKIIFSEQHNFLITSGSGVKIYSIESGDILFEDTSNDIIRLSPNGNQLWYVTGEGMHSNKIVRLDLRTLEVVDVSEPFEVRKSPEMLIHPNGKMVLISDKVDVEGTSRRVEDEISTRIVNVKSNTTLRTFGHDRLTSFRNLQFSPDGRKVIGTHENNLFVWDISDLTSSTPGAEGLEK